jgi:outer membrane protein assembly factor BamB
VPSKHFVLPTALLALLAGCSRNPSVPTTPLAVFRGDSLCFLTTSTDPAGQSLQYLFEFGDGTSDTTRFFRSGDTGYSAHVFTDTGRHAVKARARSASGRLSGWSDPLNYRASNGPGLGDTSGGWGGEPVEWHLKRWAIKRWCRFAFEVGDPDGDSVSAMFLWGDGRASGWTQFLASGSLLLDSVRYDSVGEYYVRVVLKDKRGTLAGPDTVVLMRVAEFGMLWSTYEQDYYFQAGVALRTLDGRPLIIALADDGVHGYDCNGTELWQTEMEGFDATYAPSLSPDSSRLYVTSWTRGVYCIDVLTGTIEWCLDGLTTPDLTPAVAPGGEIYIIDDADILKLHDGGNSATIDWRNAVGYVPGGVTAGGDGTVYFVECDSTRSILNALNPDGSVRWRDSTALEAGDEVCAPIIDGRGRLLAVSGENGTLTCFGPGGDVRWQRAEVYAVSGSVGIGTDDRILFQSEFDSLMCLDSTGNRVWSTRLQSDPSQSTPCICSDGTILTFNGSDLCAYGTGGEPLWEYCLADSQEYGRRGRARRDEGPYESSPVIAGDGTVYFAETWLQAFSFGDRSLARTAWPTYNHDPARSGWAGRP